MNLNQCNGIDNLATVSLLGDSLTDLSCTFCRADSGAICEIVNKCTNLRTLGLEGKKQIDNETFAAIANNLHHLRSLKVSDCESVSVKSIEVQSPPAKMTAHPSHNQLVARQCSMLECLWMRGGELDGIDAIGKHATCLMSLVVPLKRQRTTWLTMLLAPVLAAAHRRHTAE